MKEAEHNMRMVDSYAGNNAVDQSHQSYRSGKSGRSIRHMKHLKDTYGNPSINVAVKKEY